jgi:hypothetical protein
MEKRRTPYNGEEENLVQKEERASGIPSDGDSKRLADEVCRCGKI